MATTRRAFLRTGAVFGGALAVGLDAPAALGATQPDRPRRALNLLILGGTSFLGPHQIAHALERGHSVSIFTRGRTQPTIHKQLYGQVEHLVGDRADDLSALRGRSWDAVLDNSGRRTAWARDSARLLAEGSDLYLYTSSTGVYYPYLGTDIREDQGLVLEVPGGLDEGRRGEYEYGVMKATSEIEVRRAFGVDRTIVVRPTYMMGPADRTDRFPYWPVRLDRGGEIMVPGKRDDPVQYVDVRDVARFMIHLIENRRTGDFNAAGPAGATGMHEFIFGAHAAFSSAASWVMIPDYDFLESHHVGFAIPWIMPVGENFGSARVSIRRGVENGLTFRPLAESCRDILDWWYSDAVAEERRQGMLAGERSLITREPGIIADWRARP